MIFQPCPPLSQLPAPLLILGAAYSGKSELGIGALKGDANTTVIGTAGLSELEGRINQLKALRPAHWHHFEGIEINEFLTQAVAQSQQILVDSINQWLANVLLSSWTKYDLEQQEHRLKLEFRTFCETLRQSRNHRIVIVSSEIGAGVTPPQELLRFFRTLLGQFHRMIAKDCSSVVQVVAGIPLLIKA